MGAMSAVKPLLDRLEALVNGIGAVGELTPRSRDAVLAYGETLSAPLMGAAVEGRVLTGEEAGIVTDAAFGEADPLMQLTMHQVKERVAPLLEAGQRVVVTGFIAATQHGQVTTLGRGGSDYTATILGASLRAEAIWICSDVDGLMTADPRVVPGARRLESITFGEALEMGQLGAKSMHPRALEPAAEQRIAVRVMNTFNPSCAGTLITDGVPQGGIVRAVLLLKNAALVTVAGAAMVGRPGTAARVFGAMAEAGINIQMISQSVSESGISLVIGGGQLERARAVLDAQLVRPKVARRVDVEAEVAVVAAVGAGMRGTPGVAARVFSSVARERVNVLAIAQGSSELSVCFVVNASSAAAAVRAIHDEFQLGG